MKSLWWLAAVLAASGCNWNAAADSEAPKGEPDASARLVADTNRNRGRAESADAAAAADSDSDADEGDDEATPKAAETPSRELDCAESREPSIIGIASASLKGKAPELTATSQLVGEGLELTLMPQQNVAGSLRWRGDRLFVTVDTGFWEIPPEGKPTFNSASSVILWGLRAGDLDNDGDQDLIVLTLVPNEGTARTPFGSQLAVWERSSHNLSFHSDIMRTTEMRFAMPYVLGDVDADGDLDVITFEQGAPVAFINGGRLEFTREVLGQVSTELKDAQPLAIDYSDRNGDGDNDLLVILGNYATPLENSIRVLLAEGPGKFGTPGPMTAGETPLVPHGPDGVGLGIADVTGDGIADVLQQDDQSTESDPAIRFYASMGPSELAAPIELKGLGFEFADVDEDGALDIVSSLNNRLIALLSRGDGAFETRDLGVSVAAPDVMDFVVDPGEGSAPAVVHTLYRLRDCPRCDDACSGRCLFDVCIGCLSDADCEGGKCESQVCR
jgi:hypothetical protein